MKFQSTLPARGATCWIWISINTRKFQSTLPARGATSSGAGWKAIGSFQSTLPARGATPPTPPISPRGCSHFNPRSPHGERRGRFHADFRRYCISIHAPRTGSDLRHDAGRAVGREISIHAPRTGSDDFPIPGRAPIMVFQSTLLARGATRALRRHLD